MKPSRWIFGIILGICVYAIFVLFSDVSLLIEQLENIEIQFIIMGVFVVFVGLVIRALRWHLMITRLNVKINLKSTLLIYFSGTAFGLSPGRLGEVVKSHYLKRFVNTPITVSAPTIIVERFLDVFAILLIAFFAFLFSGIHHESVIFGFSALFISLFLIYQKKFLIRILTRIESIPFLGKISKNLISSIDIIFVLTQPKILGKTLSLSIISWVIEASVVYFVLKAFGISLSIITTQFIYVISSLIGSISFLPGGIGTTEGGLLGLLFLQDISYDDALGPVLVIRLIALWMTILFGVIMCRIIEITILKGK